ncbi:hypothetical protein ABZ915_17545 [Streptomyces sp. NPDC046915]|uniref:hypothetical protein n=1 Tax=Streptomyces sp. NPDC046915 TaxID=3155257 RepID=UPI00341048B1
MNPITDQQLDLNKIAERAQARHADLTQWIDRYSPQPGQAALERVEEMLEKDVRALLAEVHRLRAAMEEIRHLHKDSPMGPCPLCIDADALAEGRDGLMPYPCPTARLAGAQDCDPPHVRNAEEQLVDVAGAAAPEQTATLLVDTTSSTCGGCGQPTLPSALTHANVSGYDPKPGGGCGARFTAIRSVNRVVIDEDLRGLRPDLPIATAPAAG